ncbi:MAG: endonuclease domain-containing protein [Oscillospiraceae bacterium]|nr:endonuclease domain-containing protein [Oscillospiraceae bacterium]
MTKQEKHLWYDFLYNLKPQVLKQRPIGSYVVDFYCHAAKLAIELDGAQHYEPDAIEYDKIRTEFINSLGIEVIRVDNSDVDNNFVGTCDKIKKAIEERNPPPSADGTPFCERGQGKAICETKPENGVRYIVPQRVTISNLKSGDKFFFRVDNIYKNCRIVLKSGEKIIYSKKKIKAVPSEMESIIIDEKILDGLNKIDNIKNIVICLEK